MKKNAKSKSAEVTHKITPVQSAGSRAKQRRGDLQPSTKQEVPQPALQTPNRFRVLANLTIPVGAEVILQASSPKEAQEQTESLLMDSSFVGQLHKIIASRTISLLMQSNQQIDIHVESVLLDCPPEVMVWDMVDMNSGTNCGPKFESLVHRPELRKGGCPIAGRPTRQKNERDQ
jgi:hypothetical protein